MQPQTLEEVDQLEGLLTTALDELREHERTPGTVSLGRLQHYPPVLHVTRAVGPEGLVNCRFRLNPAYDVIPYGRLSGDDLQRFGLTVDSADLSAVLVPSADGLPVKALGRDTANLLTAVRNAEELPSEIRERFTQDVSPLLRLVLDAVLEVQLGSRFVNGPEAAEGLRLETGGSGSSTVPARLSLEALQYGQTLAVRHAQTLSARMYSYNRVPASVHWVESVSSAAAFADFVGLGSNSGFDVTSTDIGSHTSRQSTTPLGTSGGRLNIRARVALQVVLKSELS